MAQGDLGLPVPIGRGPGNPGRRENEQEKGDEQKRLPPSNGTGPSLWGRMERAPEESAE